MRNSLPQLPTTLKDGTLWLKYFTFMAIPVGLVLTIKTLLFGPLVLIIFSLLIIAGSVYVLRETHYFRQWSPLGRICHRIGELFALPTAHEPTGTKRNVD